MNALSRSGSRRRGPCRPGGGTLGRGLLCPPLRRAGSELPILREGAPVSRHAAAALAGDEAALVGAHGSKAAAGGVLGMVGSVGLERDAGTWPWGSRVADEC
jgi:hypothetical protein